MAAPNPRAATQTRRPPLVVEPAPPVLLTDLEPGQGARVVAVTGDGPEALRLLDLGFVPGTPIRVLERAPLGDPTVYALRGTSLCLRRNEARCIAVRPD